MTLFDRIKKLADSQGKTITRVEQDLNMSRNYLYKWKTMNPKSDSLEKVADYFGVTTDYLLGRNETPKWADQRDTSDLKRFLDDDAGMTYDGEDLTDEEKDQLRVALTQIFWKRRRAERKISHDFKE